MAKYYSNQKNFTESKEEMIKLTLSDNKSKKVNSYKLTLIFDYTPNNKTENETESSNKTDSTNETASPNAVD